MTSDINYNQQEESAIRNLVIWNFHVRCNLIIKWTLLGWHVRALMQEADYEWGRETLHF